MNPEPLTKEKIDEIEDKDIITQELVEKKVVDIKYVKSAVNWLLKEIEKEMREKSLKTGELIRKHDVNAIYMQGFLQGLDWCKQKIKKAFSGVIEE